MQKLVAVSARLLLPALSIFSALISSVQAAEVGSGPVRRLGSVAIVVSNRGGSAFENKQLLFEDLVSARLGELGLRVISREIVQGNLRAFVPPSAATERQSAASSAAAEAAFFDQASALSLAQNLNADFLLHLSIGGLSKTERTINAYGVKVVNTEHILTAAYKLLDASAGGSLVGEVVKATRTDAGGAGEAVTGDVVKAARQDQTNANLRVVSDGITDELLVQASEQVAASLKARVASGQIAKAAGLDGRQAVKINIKLECADLSVPDLRVNSENVVVATGAVLPAAPDSATVEVDGLAVGSAPGEIKLNPGFRRVRVSRSGFEVWERTINAEEGMSLVIALKITAEERTRWQQNTLFLAQLKAGMKLTDAQIKVLEGEAQRLASSGYKVDVKIDTKEGVKMLVPTGRR
jgi:hypothetical protein